MTAIYAAVRKLHLDRIILPAGDYGIRNGVVLAFGKAELPSQKELEQRGSRWKPYRTAASWYLWRRVELQTK